MPPDGYLPGSEFPRCGKVYVGSDGSTEVSGLLTTYPSPKSTLTVTSHFKLNVDLGEEWVVSYPETSIDPVCPGGVGGGGYFHVSEAKREE